MRDVASLSPDVSVNCYKGFIKRLNYNALLPCFPSCYFHAEPSYIKHPLSPSLPLWLPCCTCCTGLPRMALKGSFLMLQDPCRCARPAAWHSILSTLPLPFSAFH